MNGQLLNGRTELHLAHLETVWKGMHKMLTEMTVIAVWWKQHSLTNKDEKFSGEYNWPFHGETNLFCKYFTLLVLY